MGEGLLSGAFPREGGTLRCGEIPLSDIAETYGTPLYVYDLDHVERRFRHVRQAFAGADPLVAYAVKANGNLAVLAHLARLGAGADIVSLGELDRALRAGIPADRILFAGVAKTEEELRTALAAGIRAFNVESRGELERLACIAEQMGGIAPFAVRVNPDVHSPTPHEYTRTGHGESKFGVSSEEAVALYRWARGRPHLRPVGVDVHIGSQILVPEPYFRAVERVLEVVDAIAEEGTGVEFVDIGGGFGVRYGAKDAETPVVDLVAERTVASLRERGLTVVVEPGRFIVGEAGILLTRVQYVKRTTTKTLVVVDGGMTDLIRPSHYGGYHEVEEVERGEGDEPPASVVDVVGPICESGDFLARDRTMRLPEPGALLAVRTAGAYGFAMASNYNARRRPAEAVVIGGEVFLARRRETLEDLVRGEVIPPPLERR